MRVRNQTLVFKSPKFGTYLLLHTNFPHLTKYKQYQPVFKKLRSSPKPPGLRNATTNVYTNKFSFKQKECTTDAIMCHEHSGANIETQVG